MYSIQKAARLIITLAVLLGVILPGGLSLRPAAIVSYANAVLYRLAEENPAQQVAVIVQKTVAGHGAEQAATQLGGKVTKDLQHHPRLRRADEGR